MSHFITEILDAERQGFETLAKTYSEADEADEAETESELERLDDE